MTQTLQQPAATRTDSGPALPPLDPAQSWPAQGAWTYADYLRLPDDGNRYEIIDGVLYMQAAPGTDHQNTLMEIVLALGDHVRTHKLGRLYTAPYSVRLNPAAQPVQPDIMFVSTDRLPPPGSAGLSVPPDLVVEILSPSTRRRDMSVKLLAYEQGGVREYWIVDPVALTVTVYAFVDDRPEYDLIGVFTVRDSLKSVVLPDLALPVDGLFLG